MINAACVGAAYISTVNFRETDPFFPEKGQSRDNAQKQYCMRCPVILECKQYGQAIDARHGVWGGNYQNEAE